MLDGLEIVQDDLHEPVIRVLTEQPEESTEEGSAELHSKGTPQHLVASGNSLCKWVWEESQQKGVWSLQEEHY